MAAFLFGGGDVVAVDAQDAVAGANGLRPVCREKFRNLEGDVTEGKTNTQKLSDKIDKVIWLLVTTLATSAISLGLTVLGK